jgi:excisionase family DNA binding protein
MASSSGARSAEHHVIDPTKLTDSGALSDETVDVREDTVWLTAVEAAEELGVTIRHVFDLIDAGEVNARRAGRTVLVPASELARLEALLDRS